VTSMKSPQTYYQIQSIHRFASIRRLLDQTILGKTLVFCRTKKEVDTVFEKLQLLQYSVASYHGDLPVNLREKAWADFTSGRVANLILTDIPATIETLPPIDLVLFAMIPQDADMYIQRVNRLEMITDVAKVSTLISDSEFKKIAFIKRAIQCDILPDAFEDMDVVRDLKKQVLVSEIAAFDDTGADDFITQLATTLIHNHSAEKVVKYMLERGFNRQFSAALYRKKLTKSTHVNDVDLDAVANDQKERLFIAVGKTDNVDENGLKDFLHIETAIDKAEFTEIKLFDTFSFFAVSMENAEIILEIFRRKKRGKRSIVERAKGKDVIRKGRAPRLTEGSD
jgi:ATP-dependent RNA helicase DeaD